MSTTITVNETIPTSVSATEGNRIVIQPVRGTLNTTVPAPLDTGLSGGGPPAPTVPATVAFADPTPLKKGPSPLETVYWKLKELFGISTNQIFQLEFPARVLDQGTYDYLGSDNINAQQIKPQTVVDAEFRLSDDLYDVANVMGGPNGAKVSNQYSETVYSLIPKTPTDNETEKAMHLDQDKICLWLTEEVDNFTPPTEDILEDLPDKYSKHKPEIKTVGDTTASTGKIARVDLYQKLLDYYDVQRFRWASFKRNARPKDPEHAQAAEIDDFNRMLATFAPIVDSKLEALWTLVLVRGQYHRIRRLVGYIDVETASEILQKAKENLRASVFRSVDDTEDVYPVYFQPSSWARSLNTSFTPQDLLSDVVSVRDEIFQKEKARATLSLQLNELKNSNPNIETAENNERKASKALQDAQQKLHGAFADSAFHVIQIFFDAYLKYSTGGTSSIVAQLAKLGSSEFDQLNKELQNNGLTVLKDLTAFGTLKDNYIGVMQATEAFTDAAGNLSRTQALAAQARADNVDTSVAALTERIDSLTRDIEYLTETLKGADNPLSQNLTANGGSKPANSVTVPKVPVLPNLDTHASLWTEIRTEEMLAESSSSKLNSSMSSNSSWNTDLFWYGESSKSQEAHASQEIKHHTTDTSVQVAFHAMKVTINRPWMDTGLYKMAGEFYANHAENLKISSSEPDDVRKGLGLNDGGTPNPGDETVSRANKSLLPTWPVAFIVAKNVHIVYKTTTTDTSFTVDDYSKSMSDGGGFLWFSSGASSRTEMSHNETTSVLTDGKTMSIRIPAPQIIGWVCELCPKTNEDNVSNYQALDKSEFGEMTLGS